jgi:hypothetical protein
MKRTGTALRPLASAESLHHRIDDERSKFGNAQRCVMVEAAPSPPFEVPEPDFLFEFLIVALDAPAQLGNIDELPEGDFSWKR